MKTSRWVVVTYVILILAGVIAALPNMFTPKQLASMPSWLPKHQITLGLDLQGGSHLVLEVDAAALRTDRLRALLDDVRATLRKERIDARSARISSGVISVTIDNRDQLAKAQAAINAMAIPVGIGGQKDLDISKDGATIRIALTEAGINDRIDSALRQSLEIVRQRVDQVGVAEPTIQRVGADRILVQLPGLQDPTRLRQLLGSTAKMGRLAMQLRNIGMDKIQFITIPNAYFPRESEHWGRVYWTEDADRVWARIREDKPLTRNLTTDSISAAKAPGAAKTDDADAETPATENPDDGTATDQPTPDEEAVAEARRAVGLCA